MKTLIIFYSFEGNTKLIAEKMAHAIGADIAELKPQKEIRSKGFMKYFWAGKQVMFKQRPALEKLEKDLKDYDMIFLGSPVWAGTFAPAVRSFLENHDLENKKIALFCTCGGNQGRTFNEMKSMLSNNEILGEKEFVKILEGKEQKISEAIDWAKAII